MLVVIVRAVEDSLQTLTEDDFLLRKNKPVTHIQKNMGHSGEMRKDTETSEGPSFARTGTHSAWT